MHKKYTRSLFIFRRDLRLQDNTALIQALENSQEVICCFIVDPRQATQENEYKSIHALQFMYESLEDLSSQMKEVSGRVYFFYGITEEVLEKLITTMHIEAVFLNQDYTPFSRLRDNKIEKICKKNNISFESYEDYLLNSPHTIANTSGTPFSIFTAFFKRSQKNPVTVSKKNIHKNYFTDNIALSKSLPLIFKTILPAEQNKGLIQGGRSAALKILSSLKKFDDYVNIRNYPSEETTHLSAHNKFGTVSIREVYYKIYDTLGLNTPLITQLYWRDFFTHIAWHHPRVFGKAFHEQYDALPWNSNEEWFKKWCTGNTGFPIVDAGMRQLNKTGFMHNRVRLIVGSFLVKDLHIDWQWGEKYFAQQLIDYDPSVNNGNWQWVASTGCDATPYFRIFNPWLQQKKYDPECIYIKKWIPELKHFSVQEIHQWFKQKQSSSYPTPMVDHAAESELTKKVYRQILANYKSKNG